MVDFGVPVYHNKDKIKQKDFFLSTRTLQENLKKLSKY